MRNSEIAYKAIQLLNSLASSNEILKAVGNIKIEHMYLWEKTNKLIDLLKEEITD